MDIKQLHERLRLLEPQERIAITAGEVRALMNYTMALVVEDMAGPHSSNAYGYERLSHRVRKGRKRHTVPITIPSMKKEKEAGWT